MVLGFTLVPVCNPGNNTPPCCVLSPPFLLVVGPTTPSPSGWDLQPDKLQSLRKCGVFLGGVAGGGLKPVLEDASPGNHSEGWMSWVCKTLEQSTSSLWV